jgi:RNA polymerase sigma-70 factor (ECF subfamily)
VNVSNNINNRDVDSFVRLFASHQGQIYSYILALVGNYNDADDVLQETSSKMWELFGSFRPGTDFLKWARSVAYYRVLEYRKKYKRNSKVIYSEQFLELVSESSPKYLSKTNEHLELLKYCVGKLRPPDVALIKMRYVKSMRVSEIASCVNRTVRNVYFSLSRIQRQLLKCMSRKRIL